MLDSNSEVNTFRAGEVDMIYPQNQIGLRKKIEAVDGAEYTSTLGPQWEHFDMLSTVPGLDDLAGAQGDRHRHAPPADRRPRREGRQRRRRGAGQHAVDDQPEGSTRPNWSMYPATGDVEAANAILDAAGWMPGSDGVRAKDGVKLAFTVGTTSGNQARSSPSRSSSSSSRRSA